MAKALSVSLTPDEQRDVIANYTWHLDEKCQVVLRDRAGREARGRTLPQALEALEAKR